METTFLQQKPTATKKTDTSDVVLEKIKQRSAEAQAIETAKAEERAKAEAQAELDALTDFDKSLFKNGNVDFENYIEVTELFSKFNEEAMNGVDVRFSDYQKSLLHLLKHCYGYMYELKTNSERYTNDIQHINSAISGLNRSSNTNNSLSAKIIKLVWRHERVDRRRISTYAKVLDNAWCKGEVDNTTDKKGSLLPKYFEKEVLSYGGINNFSRQSANSIQKQKELEAEGYSSLAEKKIAYLDDALTKGTFEWEGKSCAMPKAKFTIPTESNNQRDGELTLFLVRNDRENNCLVPTYVFDDAEFINKAKLSFFNALCEKAEMPKAK